MVINTWKICKYGLTIKIVEAEHTLGSNELKVIDSFWNNELKVINQTWKTVLINHDRWADATCTDDRGGFSILTFNCRGIWTSDLLITGQPALPPSLVDLLNIMNEQLEAG